MFIFRKRAILRSVRFIWFSCFRSFLFCENVVQKTKGRSGQTKKTGFLLLFSLRFRYDYVRLNKQPFGLQHFAFESTSEIRPARICRKCEEEVAQQLSHMDLPLLHFIQFLQKKSAISYLQTCNINLAFLSLVYSSTNKSKTGKSNTSVVHGLHTSQLSCPTEIWFIHKCRQFRSLR